MPTETANEALHYPFKEAGHQRESALFGMWIFLVTEVLFFGGLFTAYLVYRFSHAQAFAEAAQHQEWYLGCLNTAVLLLSGFTMALAVEAVRRRDRTWLLRLFIVTWLLGAIFLGIEGWEYHRKFVEHLVPGRDFHFQGSDPAGPQMFFCLYFTMTGLHMFHVSVGLILIFLFGAWSGWSSRPFLHPNRFEVLGLYWAFVDIVWLFLYPLFYLINPS
jgi:cytochrome c oxidase subunit III